MTSAKKKSSHAFKVGERATVKTYDYASETNWACERVITVVKANARLNTDDGSVWYRSTHSEKWKRYGKGAASESLHPYEEGDEERVEANRHRAERRRLEKLAQEAERIVEEAKRLLAEAQRRFDQANAKLQRILEWIKRLDASSASDASNKANKATP